ncbi:MAG: hypothetical protein M3071_13730 [Actinomycetota bacterium]|nr:hypothetical protein [Actinomycetota bacterium]
MVVLEQSLSKQPFSGRVFLGAAESFAGALLPRAGQRAVQHRGRGDVERPARSLTSRIRGPSVSLW